MPRGWKLTENKKYSKRYNSIVTGIHVRIGKFAEGEEVGGKYKWQVIIDNDESVFKTKPEALRFANKYMREHPRG